MLNIENLEQFAKLKQTDVENTMREYYQHLFLSFLYQNPGSEGLLFKGGTAMRIIFQSPRFSEDIELFRGKFTGKGKKKSKKKEVMKHASVISYFNNLSNSQESKADLLSAICSF